MMRREKDKLVKTLGGIRDMSKLPAAVWVVDTKKEHLAISEAQKLGIPVVAILDTNCDPDEVTYGVPGNDDAIRAVSLLTRVVADAAAEGLVARSAGRARTGAEAEVAAPDAEPLPEWEAALLAGAEAEQTGQAGSAGQAEQSESAESAPAEQSAAPEQPAAEASGQTADAQQA